MKLQRTYKSLVAFACLGVDLSLGTTIGRANETLAHASSALRAAQPGATVVATHTALSAQDIAKYQQMAGASEHAATNHAAGAGSDKTVWIVVGVIAVVAVVAVAASGGGGGGGGGY